MERFLKGIIVGLGGVAPGLSGSVLLIIFGLYQKTLEALGTLLVDFRKKIRFLLPLVCGMFLGVLLFSKLIDFLLAEHEMPTRFCFLGLILGTVPMVWKEVRKEGFSPKFYMVILLAAVFGTWMFTVNAGNFPQVTDPTLLQCILLGVAVAATAIIPGVDPAVFLSSLGFYEMYVGALADFNTGILVPMVIGLALGAVGISFVMSSLFRRFYTTSYSVIFGIFLSMIPNMLSDKCVLSFNGASALSLGLLVLGFLVSYYLGDIQGNDARLRAIFKREKGRE
jgi:putative membrane protein